jgi:serine kinase of HPr protein (carbohydrate metabolism regulator)
MDTLVHASCVVVDNVGCLLLGPSGSGKSDLALRLVMDHSARLVADDQVMIERRRDRLIASPPAPLAGLIEVRGLGILRMPHRASAALGFAMVLVDRDEVERLPEAEEGVEYLGVALPLLRLAPFDASAPHKVRLAARLRKSSIRRRS